MKVGDVVRNKLAPPDASPGRLCHIGTITCCVQFPAAGCLRVAKNDLEVTSGEAPECSEACSRGEC
jgi:hypothetical protein